MASQARPRVVADLRLVRLVGEGGEGEVWEARDTRGRRRALKLIRPDALVPPEEVERRGRWLLAIDHPALVAVHRCGVLEGAGLDGWGFVEMSYVDGPAMDDAPADPAALERLEPLAEALDHLHAGTWSQGVPLVHRDVKPANLIQTEDGGLVLVDVSTLRDVSDGTRTRIGTPLFAAPEVVTGRAGPLADVYAFAATAVALLTGARRSELASLLENPYELDVPEGLRAALSVDPARRPVSCRAALDPRLPLVVGAEVGWEPVPPAPGGSDAAHGDPYEEDWLPASAAREDDWLPPASEVLLDPWHAEPPRPRGGTGGWLVVLAAVAAGLALTLPSSAQGDPADPLRWLAIAPVAAIHLAACLAAGASSAESVFAPPLAWASLLSDRAALPGPVRSWARTSLLACTSVLLLSAVGAGLEGVSGLDPASAAVLGSTALAACVAVIAAVGAGRLWRIVLSPVWALGVAILAVGAAALLIPALLFGRAGALLSGVGRSLGGAAAFVLR